MPPHPTLPEHLQATLPRLLPPGERVLVACSGGADSTALLLALHSLTPTHPLELTVAHIQHGLRAASARHDHAAVAHLARRLELPLAHTHLDTRAFLQHHPGLGLERAARELRYAALEHLARQHHCTAVLTAHHRDDLIETILLRWLRGTGLPGLAAMSPSRPISPAPDAPRLVRPLLELPRTALHHWLHTRGEPHRSDPTNHLPDAARRNRVRLELLPALRARVPQLDQHLLAIAASSARLQPHLGLTPPPHDRPPTPRSLSLELLRALPLWLRSRTVRQLILDATGMPPLRRHTEAALRLITRPHGGGEIHLPAGWRLRRERTRLTVTRDEAPPSPPNEPVPLAVPGSTPLPDNTHTLEITPQPAPPLHEIRRAPTHTAWIDRTALGNAPLYARPPRPGDRMRPLGLGGSRKLQDLFTDAGVPRHARTRHWIITAGERPVWLAGLRLDERFAVRHPGQPALRLTLRTTHGR